MKKLSILFVSIMTLGLTALSCSSNDDDNTSGSIEGKWQVTEMGAVLDGKEILQPYTNDGGCANDIVEYTATASKFVDSYSEYTDGKCKAYTQEGTWKKDGNTLTKKYASDDEEKFEITELSGSKLKMKQTYTASGITVSAVIVYKKI